MKSKRLPQFSPENQMTEVDVSFRGVSSMEQTKVSEKGEFQDISEALVGCFDEEKGGILRLKDEFSQETIDFVIQECRTFLSGSVISVETWTAIGNFLEKEIFEFSRLKEELVFSERKCGMVQQKASEASQPKDGQVSQNRLMACAMLLAETEMRRDHLQERISMVIDEFVAKILKSKGEGVERDCLELRLRGVFGSL
ncbi:MAG: hypothetical protein QNK82_14150 [Akkermansiaceae bacterium]|jgi:hypothetical protein